MKDSILSVSEIKAALHEAQPPFICLQDEAGNKLIPWNAKEGAGVFPKEYLNKILKRLDAKVTGPGTYYVCFAENVTPKSIVQRLTFIKGGGAPGAPAPAAVSVTTNAGDISRGISSEKAMELIEANANLRADLAAANADIKILTSQVQELEDELAGYENAEEKPAGLFEGPQMQEKVFSVIDLIAAKFLAPAPPAAPAAVPLAQGPPQQISYEMICATFNARPDLLERLIKDLQQAAPENGQAQPQPQPAQ